MKHIKLFESSDEVKLKIKQYFHKLIEWKTFNYLIDRITKYEDVDYNVTVLVVIGNPTTTNHMSIFGYTTTEGTQYIMPAGFETVVNTFEEFDGIFYYRIFMHKLHNKNGNRSDLSFTPYVIDFIDDLYRDLYHRFIKVDTVIDDELIIVERL